MAVNILTDIEAVLYKLPAEYTDKDQGYIGVVITLAEYLMEGGRYREAYEFCEKAHSYSVNYRKGYQVHSIAYLKAVCLMKMGKQEEALEFFKQAYFGYIGYGDKETAVEILEKINTAYGISIETYGTDTLEFDFKPPDFEPLERGDVPKFEDFNDLLWILRTEKKLSQNKLSKGICSKSYYTKIEGGEFPPNIYQKEALLQRLGRFPYYYTYNFLSNEEFMTDKIKKGIVSAISRVEYE